MSLLLINSSQKKPTLGRISGRILVACSTVQGFNVNYSLFMRQRVEAV